MITFELQPELREQEAAGWLTSMLRVSEKSTKLTFRVLGTEKGAVSNRRKLAGANENEKGQLFLFLWDLPKLMLTHVWK